MNEKIIEKIIKAKNIGDVLGLLPSGWIGTSASNQEQANDAIGDMLRCDGQRLLYLEPLLGFVDLQEPFGCVGLGRSGPYMRGIDWVIVGGNDRPMHPDWVRSIRDQCVEARVPFFFKQWGEWRPFQQFTTGELLKIGTSFEAHNFGSQSDDINIRVGKKAAGRLLDGREWNEIPGLNENE